MTGRSRLDELFSLACWEPCEEAEAAAIIDTLEADDGSADAAGVWLRSAIYFQRLGLTLEAEVAELRRILYAAIDPETGARTAQDVRDLIQGELNAIATTREVIAPGSLPPRRGPRPQSTEKQGPGALTSFGADDWATVEAGLHPMYPAAYNALARLRAADQAKTEALRMFMENSILCCPLCEAQDVSEVEVASCPESQCPLAKARDALAAAAAAPKETP